MANCDPGQEDITKKKNGAKIGISIMSIMYFAFLLFLFSYFSFRKEVKNKGPVTPAVAAAAAAPSLLSADTYLGRFESWFVVKAKSSINSGMIIAILAAGLVLGFNGLIMTPLITTIFPDQEIGTPLIIPGKTLAKMPITVNPGQFFIACIGFIFSLVLLFFLAELLYFIHDKIFKTYTVYVLMVILTVFLTFMLIWNAIYTDKILKQPDCVNVGAANFLFNVKHGGTEVTTAPKNTTEPVISPPPLPQFGSFV
jgi:hypothetical protein